MKYFKGWCTLPLERYISGTEKAFCFTVANGYTTSNDTNLYIPKSLIKVSEPNEVGNVQLYLPVWFVAKNGIYKQIERIREVDFNEIVEI